MDWYSVNSEEFSEEARMGRGPKVFLRAGGADQEGAAPLLMMIVVALPNKTGLFRPSWVQVFSVEHWLKASIQEKKPAETFPKGWVQMTKTLGSLGSIGRIARMNAFDLLRGIWRERGSLETALGPRVGSDEVRGVISGISTCYLSCSCCASGLNLLAEVRCKVPIWEYYRWRGSADYLYAKCQSFPLEEGEILRWLLGHEGTPCFTPLYCSTM